MIKRTILAAMALSLTAGPLAALADPPQGYDQGYGQEHHDRGDHDRDHYDRDHHDRDHDDGDHHDRGNHEGWYKHHEHGRFMSGRYVRPHGYYEHRWRRGDRLPPDYRASGYVIPDVAVYNLRPPPRGYYWIRVDNNAVLAAVATGVVIDVSLNLFH